MVGALCQCCHIEPHIKLVFTVLTSYTRTHTAHKGVPVCVFATVQELCKTTDSIKKTTRYTAQTPRKTVAPLTSLSSTFSSSPFLSPIPQHTIAHPCASIQHTFAVCLAGLFMYALGVSVPVSVHVCVCVGEQFLFF